MKIRQQLLRDDGTVVLEYEHEVICRNSESFHRDAVRHEAFHLLGENSVNAMVDRVFVEYDSAVSQTAGTTEPNFSKPVKDAIRWHYYDIKRGNDSADPSCSGMDSDILLGLESLFTADAVAQLKAEGIAMAERELYILCHEVDKS